MFFLCLLLVTQGVFELARKTERIYAAPSLTRRMITERWMASFEGHIVESPAFHSFSPIVIVTRLNPSFANSSPRERIFLV